MSLILSTELTAQVIIKEKVEINPKSTISTYQLPAYTPCGPWITSYDKNNPWQVVWNSISFAPDPYQQLFNFQNNRYGPGLQRRNYILDPNKYYNITLLQPDEYSYFTYGGFWDINAGNYVPRQYVGTTLSGVLGSDIGATAWFDYSIDPPNGLYHNYSKYTMIIKRDVPPGTEIIMSVFDGQETINYHTRVETPTFTIQSDTPEDTLLHNQSKEIDFLLYFQNNCQIGNYGGAYPTGIKFNVEIVQGQQYGNLYYPGTAANPEQTGSSITNLEDEYGGGICNYVIRYTADGVQPDTSIPGIVTIRCTANDADIAPAEVSFPIKYSEKPPPSIGGYILVDFNKDSFSPGDTAVANCKWLTAYNEIIDFPGDQSFNAEIVSGKEYGILLDPNTGTVANNLQGVSNGFKVITPTSIPYDSVVIRIKVTTIAGGGGIIAAKTIGNQNQNTQAIQSKETVINKSTKSMSSTLFIGNPGMLIEGFGDVVVKKPNEILLGETKYFAVKRKTETGELKIEEIKTDYGEKPKFPADADGWKWLTSDVWGNNPIEKLGTKSGVYWEKKWFRGSDNSSQPLADGMIRLIGRYWEEGKEDSFKVKLKTTTNAEVELKIVRPNKLGNKYNYSKDVFDKSISIDSICIKYGGETGIPPQFIKGQIENEAPGFFPPYRYEPLSTELNNRNNSGEIISKKWKDSPFFVTVNSMGIGDPVPTHYNLKYIPYFKTPTKVWDILKKYSQIEDNSPTGVITLYCKNENGKLNFKKFGYKTAQDKYNGILKHFQGIKENPVEEDYVAARDSTIKYFKYYWYGGLDNIYAQTRIFASYGLLQTMYETALNRGFVNNSFNIPEKLNINDVSWPLTSKHLIKLLKEVLDMEFNSNDWALGYENIFKAMAKKWNPWMTDYDLEALNNSKKYFPRGKN